MRVSEEQTGIKYVLFLQKENYTRIVAVLSIQVIGRKRRDQKPKTYLSGFARTYLLYVKFHNFKMDHLKSLKFTEKRSEREKEERGGRKKRLAYLMFLYRLLWRQSVNEKKAETSQNSENRPNLCGYLFGNPVRYIYREREQFKKCKRK